MFPSIVRRQADDILFCYEVLKELMDYLLFWPKVDCVICSCDNIFSFYHSKSIIFILQLYKFNPSRAIDGYISKSVHFPLGGMRYHGYKSVKIFNFSELISIPDIYIHPLMVIIKSNLRNYLRKTICYILKFVCKPKM